MANASIFRDFITALRERWRSELPEVRPVADAFGPAMPKASTFYAGFSRQLGMHLFLAFQHSSKSWEVGSFTVNVVLSKREGAPKSDGGPFPPYDGAALTEGSYRIGHLLGRDDKWWLLTADSGPVGRVQWRAKSYCNRDAVLRTAADDVTRDVRAALAKLGVVTAEVAAGKT